MRNLCVLSILFICFNAVPTFGKKVLFEGKEPPERRSITILSLIEGNVEETDGLLQLDFLSDLGNIVVTISDAGGNIVYQQEVLAEEGIPYVVSLEELSIREGTVIVSNGNNTIFGEFIY